MVALLVSAFAHWRQVKWARIAGRAHVQIAAIEGERPTTALLERMRAALSVEFEPVGTGGHMLVVRNEGPATAHGVTIDLAPRAAPLGRRWPLRTGVAPELLNSPFPATICPRAKATTLLNENLARSRSSAARSSGRTARAPTRSTSTCQSADPPRAARYVAANAGRRTLRRVCATWRMAPWSRDGGD
jgi:hypothetical protein